MDEDFPPMKIHPKKTAEEIGTLAAKTNSWYENENSESEANCSENEIEAFPAMKPLVITKAGNADLTVKVSVDTINTSINRKRKADDDECSLQTVFQYNVSSLESESNRSQVYKALQFALKLKAQALSKFRNSKTTEKVCVGCLIDCGTQCCDCNEYVCKFCSITPDIENSNNMRCAACS